MSVPSLYKKGLPLSKDHIFDFISGPRQVGKTTLAKAIAQDFANHIYFIGTSPPAGPN